MSETDKRVVQMEFDNSKFDKNVKKSSATLSKFEEQLKFKDVSDSLNVVKRGFSSFEIAGITAVSRITNAVIDLGVKITKSLSIDQISSGWQKFGDKTIAVATLAAQKIVIAGKELDVYSDKMEGIYDQLEKLEWFTNETSYTFNDMVAALGKFTAAGQDLDRSVNAMMGIANWAAMSGANAQKASSAMTQLAQTLGRGYVLRIDWQSIQTLNMDTSMFRETVLKTAEEMGKLKKAGNDFISNTGKKITSVNFTETLASKWFTSDILVKTLEKYSAAVQDIYEISEKEGISARAVIEKYRDSLDQFGVAAFEAAQQTRTLGEAIVYVMSTIGSTWSQTFEKIFGSFEQAKELWSDLSDALYEDVIASNDFRNATLNVWKDLEGRKDLFEHGGKNQGVFWNIYDSIIAIKNIFSSAKEAIFPKTIFESEADQANELGLRFKEFTKRLQESTSQMLKNIQNDTKFLNILKGIYSVIRIIIVSVAGVWNAISPIVDALKGILDNLLSRLSILGNRLSNSTSILESIMTISNKLREVISSVIDEINPEGILNDIIGLFNSVANLIKGFFKNLNDTGKMAENFERIVKGLASALSILIKIIKQVVNLLNKYVTPVVVNVLDVVSDILATIIDVITEALATVADFFTAINDMLNGNETDLSGYGKVVNDFIKSLPSKLKKLEPVLKGLLNIIESLIDVLMAIPKALNNVSKSLTGRSIVDNIAYIFDTIAGVIKKFASVLKKETPDGDAKNIFNPIIILVQGILDLLKGLLSILGPMISIIGQVLSAMGSILEGIGKILSQFVKEGKIANDKIFKVIAILAVSTALILAVLKFIFWIRDGILSLINPLYYLKEVMEESLWNFSIAAKLRSIAFVIESIGAAFLMLSLSMLIIGKLDKNEFIRSVAVLSSFVIVIGALAIVLTILNKKMGVFEKSTSLFKKGAGAFSKNQKAVIGSLDGVTDFIKALSKAMIKFSLALAIISWIPEEDMWRAFGALAAFVGIISALTIVVKGLDTITKIFGKKGIETSNSLQSLALLTEGMAKMLFKFALSMLILSWIPEDNMKKAFGAIAAFVGLLVGVVIVIELLEVAIQKITKKERTLKGSGNAIFGIAETLKNIGKMLLKFAIAMAILSLIPVNDMWKAMGVISLFMALISGLIVSITLTAGKSKNAGKAIDKLADVIKSISGSLLKFVLAIGLLALLLKNGNIDQNMMWSAFGILAALLAVLSGMIIAINLTTGKNKNADKSLSKLALVIGMLSLFVVSFGGAMLMITKVPVGNIIAGSAGLILLFGMISLMLEILGNVAKSLSKDKLGQLRKIILSTLIPLSVLLLAFGASMMLLSGVPWSKILMTGITISGIIAVMAAMSKIAKPDAMLDVAKSLLLITPALLIFAGAMMLMQNIKWETFLMMAASIAVMVVSLLALGLLGTTFGEGIMIAATGALILSVALLALAISVALLSTYFVQFCTAVSENADSIRNAIIVMAQLIVVAFAAIISGILQSFIDIVPLIGEVITTIITTICDVIVNTASTIIEAIKAIFVGILNMFIETAPLIFEAITVLFTGILEVLITLAPLVFQWMETVVLGILQVLINSMSKFLQFLSTLIAGLLQIAIDNLPKFLELLNNLLAGLLEILIQNTPLFIEWLTELIKGFLKLIRDTIPDLLETLLVVIDSCLDFLVGLVVTIAEHIFDVIIGILDVLISKIPIVVVKSLEAIGTFIGSILAGIPVLFEKIVVGVIELMNGLANTIKKYKDDFREAGRNLMDALGQGIGELATAPLKLIKSIGKGMIDGFKNLFGIHSPSRVFKGFGKYMLEGLDEGLSDANTLNEVQRQVTKDGEMITNSFSNSIADSVMDSAGEITSATDVLQDAIKEVSDYVSENVDDEDMTIKPILDLSDVDKGVGNIKSLMSGISGGAEVSVTGDIAAKTSRAIERKNSESVAGSRNQNNITNEGDNYYSTFNITTNDPEEFAKEADTILQKLRLRANLAKGGAR